MSDSKPAVGTIGWIDLTVKDADRLKDFYKEVVGWDTSPVSMGDYIDFNVSPPGSENPIAGICHAKGSNSNIPAAWIMYIVVEDIDASIEACKTKGGKIIAGPKEMGNDRYCFIKDPAGAVSVLYQKG